jgi:hypothetical protein
MLLEVVFHVNKGFSKPNPAPTRLLLTFTPNPGVLRIAVA